MFLTLEGPEGSGKSSNAAWLVEWLAARGRRVLRVREPGGTPLGEQIRSLLLDAASPLTPCASLLLFEAARAELVETVIKPALADGDVVVSDRFADSTLAYQGYGEGLPLDDILLANRLATGGLQPDLSILLDLDPSIGLARRKGSEEWNVIDARSLEFHRRVRDGFLQLAAVEPSRWLVLDANRPLAIIRSDIAARLERVPALRLKNPVDPLALSVGEAKP